MGLTDRIFGASTTIFWIVLAFAGLFTLRGLWMRAIKKLDEQDDRHWERYAKVRETEARLREEADGARGVAHRLRERAISALGHSKAVASRQIELEEQVERLQGLLQEALFSRKKNEQVEKELVDLSQKVTDAAIEQEKAPLRKKLADAKAECEKLVKERDLLQRVVQQAGEKLEQYESQAPGEANALQEALEASKRSAEVHKRRADEFFDVIERVLAERDQWREMWHAHGRAHLEAQNMLESALTEARAAGLKAITAVNRYRSAAGQEPIAWGIEPGQKPVGSAAKFRELLDKAEREAPEPVDGRLLRAEIVAATAGELDESASMSP